MTWIAIWFYLALGFALGWIFRAAFEHPPAQESPPDPLEAMWARPSKRR